MVLSTLAYGSDLIMHIQQIDGGRLSDFTPNSICTTNITLPVCAAKALTRVRGCAVSSESSLITVAIRIISSEPTQLPYTSFE